MMRILIFAFACLWFSSGPVRSEEVRGRATVIDGETLEVEGRRFRLWGIDAPDLRQTCRLGARPYPCGRISATALMDFVVSVPVRCREVTGAAGVARCWAADYELSEGMVHTGWALAMPRDHARFAPIEKRAAAAKRGLWRGEFVKPWEWKPTE
jgi:endonuclease YncB( thermonuclease family)